MRHPIPSTRVRLASMLALLLATGLVAQTRSPVEFLGYEPGARYTPHARVVAYAGHVAETSERVTIQRYGTTNEGRELLLLFVTSPENHARLDELRERMTRLADPRRLAATESAESLVRDLPVFVWLSYNVHGNETSCTEAAIRTLHEIATSTSEEVTRFLTESIVILDPCINPDGRDRYVNWFNSVVGKVGDPNLDSIEHDEPWPGGRFNHYGFDLNRDWAFMTQIETRSRLPEFVKWTPQVHVDFHEMGRESSYFFFPADRPVNDNFPPNTIKWGEVFGRGNAAAFDARGWDYFTAESYDLFYPGYGDSWPSLHGAIGMTYEQAGGSSAGIVVRRRDGSLLSLRDRVDHHFTTSMATIKTAVEHREELLLDFHRFRRTAVEEGRGGEMRDFVLLAGRDLERSGHLIELLIAQGIEVRRATDAFTARDVTDFAGRHVEERSFPAGAYLVSLAQPTKRLVKTLLEPRTVIKELYFYDVSAWSLPLAYGVEGFWTGQPVVAPAEEIRAPLRPVGAVSEGDARYGYLLRWDTMSAVRAVIKLLAGDIRVRSASREFTLDGQVWPRGTVFVPRGSNPEDLSARLQVVASETGATFVPARSGMTEKGIDLGSDRMIELVKPRVGLLAGPGIGVTSYGSTRFVVEEMYGIPYSSFDAASLGRVDLDDYTCLVIPSGSPELSEAARDNLTRFVHRGGVLVALGRAAVALSKEGSGFASVSTAAAADQPEKKEHRSIEELEAERRRRSTPGSIFKVELDPAHPLSFGYDEEIAVFQSGMASFAPEGGGIAVARFADAPPVSGYIIEESEKKLRGRGYANVQPMGRGQVVLFAGDPNFRSVWHGLTRLFLNAVLLLPTP